MRRTKLNEKLIQEVYELLKEGHYNEDVALAVGISDRAFYSYITKGEETEQTMIDADLDYEAEDFNPEEHDITEYEFLCFQFMQTVKRAGNEAKMEALRNIRKAGKRNWQAEAWYLERKFRHQFGRVQMIEDSSSTEKQKTSLLERMIAGVDAIAQEDDEE